MGGVPGLFSLDGCPRCPVGSSGFGKMVPGFKHNHAVSRENEQGALPRGSIEALVKTGLCAAQYPHYPECVTDSPKRDQFLPNHKCSRAVSSCVLTPREPAALDDSRFLGRIAG